MKEFQMSFSDQVNDSLRVDIDQRGYVSIMHKKADGSWEGSGYSAGVWETICEIADKGTRIARAANAEANTEQVK